MAIIDKVKAACRVTSDAFDGELNDLITAALKDIGITDVRSEMLVLTSEGVLDALILRAVITYCRMNFGYLATDQYNKFKASYDEQKAQLLMSSEYTDWGDINA